MSETVTSKQIHLTLSETICIILGYIWEDVILTMEKNIDETFLNIKRFSTLNLNLNAKLNWMVTLIVTCLMAVPLRVWAQLKRSAQNNCGTYIQIFKKLLRINGKQSSLNKTQKKIWQNPFYLLYLIRDRVQVK